jgi:transcriptional regulator GlxA family with amidase domain
LAGGNGTEAAALDMELIDWIRRAARRSRRVTSVCSGAFLLAQAGLLDGKRATTHWSVTDLLGDLFPDVDVDPDRIYVKDGSTYTSAGVTAGMDLALALVEEDHGAAAALEIARQLVLFVHRPGGQSQFSVQLEAQAAERHPIRDAQTFIADHLAADLSVGALAGLAHMSTRNFARCFRSELGVTPAAYVERARVEAARRLLESSDRSVAAIASECGFGTVETLHRSFRRSVHVTPGEYRRHFTTSRQEQAS